MPESEWDEQQQAWMLALAEYRASRCPCGCGHAIADTTAKEGTFVWRTRKTVCIARDTLAAAQKAYDGTHGDALLWWVEKA